jgi:RimJ/RimL family protein N-acetyltransferase
MAGMANSTDLPIETERLILRQFQKSDLDAMMAYHALPDVQRYLDWKARDRVEVKAALDAMVKQSRLTRPGDIIHLAVTRKSDDLLIGQISLRWTDATAGQAELRFIFSPFHRKQGYATEAVRAAMDFGFANFRFHRIFARCAGNNQASARLLKGLGMRLEAHYREHALFQGEWDEELHFAILDREWGRSGKVREFPRGPGKEISRDMVA